MATIDRFDGILEETREACSASNKAITRIENMMIRLRKLIDEDYDFNPMHARALRSSLYVLSVSLSNHRLPPIEATAAIEVISRNVYEFCEAADNAKASTD